MDALNGPDLCKRLGIDAKQLTAWLRAGLPSTGRGQKRTFDPGAVRDWLLANNLAEPLPEPAEPTNQPIAHTWAQVAEYFQVSERTVASWIKQGMPGKSGRPGTREGVFPLHDIESWREGRKPETLQTGDETKSQAQARLAAVKAAREELQLRRDMEKLVDVEDVTRRWVRLTHEAKAQLLVLPTQISKALPVDRKLRKKCRARVKRCVDRALSVLEVFLQTEAAEVEAAGETVKDDDGSSDA